MRIINSSNQKDSLNSLVKACAREWFGKQCVGSHVLWHILAAAGTNDDFNQRIDLSKSLGGLDSIQPRHFYICDDQGNAALMSSIFFQGVQTILRLNNLESSSCKKRSQAFTKHGIIVNNQHLANLDRWWGRGGSHHAFPQVFI